MTGAEFREIRTGPGAMTQRGIAALLGTFQWRITLWERDQREIPDEVADYMHALARGQQGPAPEIVTKRRVQHAKPQQQLAVVEAPPDLSPLCGQCLCFAPPALPCGCRGW